MSRVRNVFRQIGRRGYFVLDIGRGLGDPGTWIADVSHQMRVMP